MTALPPFISFAAVRAIEFIAHRGASREKPENTLAAFARALDVAASAVELDVHTTNDGVVVVHHDAVPRAATTQPALRGRAISTLSHAELSTFRVDGEIIPTLADVLDLLAGRAAAYVEMKGAGIARDVIACLRGHPRTSCVVHGFDHRAISEVHALAPDLPLGILVPSYTSAPAAALAATGARDLWPEWQLIDRRLVERTHAAGGRVIAWTVNGAGAARVLAEMGVDALCTDDVPAIRAALAVDAHPLVGSSTLA
ncbi:MAG: glycerophosphodiester phosphodiesterase [Gemmatimonadaceae bacterium]